MYPQLIETYRGRSRTAATSKMERFVIIVNGCKPLTIITKRSILDVAAVLDPPLNLFIILFILYNRSAFSKISLNIGILLRSFLINVLFNRVAYCFLINFNFLSPHTTHFDNIIIPPFIALETCKIVLFVFSPNFRQ